MRNNPEGFNIVEILIVILVLIIIFGSILYSIARPGEKEFSEPERIGPDHSQDFKDVSQKYLDFNSCVRNCGLLNHLPTGENTFFTEMHNANYKTKCESDCEDEWFRIRML